MKLSHLSSNFALTLLAWRLGYLNPALNNPAQVLLKANRKFSCPTGQANTGYWLCTKMLCIIVPNRRTPSPEFFLWVRTWWLLTCLAHAPKKCTLSGNFQFDITIHFKILSTRKLRTLFRKYKLELTTGIHACIDHVFVCFRCHDLYFKKITALGGLSQKLVYHLKF